MSTKVVGTGDYMYDVQKNWAKLPSGWAYGWVCGVGVDSQDRLYICHRGKHPVVVFDRDGNFVTSWGDDVLDDVHHITIGPDDHAYVTDRDSHEVVKFTLEGEKVMVLGNRDYPSLQAPFNHPTSVAVAPTGEIYVSDGYANSRVHKFSSDGQLILSWGSPGTGPGQFWVPHAIALSSQGEVYVADRENLRIQVFTTEGEFIRQWSDVFLPTDVALDRNDNIYVTELVTSRFHVWDRMGKLLARGRTDDQCHAICPDSRGDLYVAQVFQRNVEKYVRRGTA